jgi:hypothetical protein
VFCLYSFFLAFFALNSTDIKRKLLQVTAYSRCTYKIVYELAGYRQVKNSNSGKCSRAGNSMFTCVIILKSYKNTSGSLGEREMLWKLEPEGQVFRYFGFF